MHKRLSAHRLRVILNVYKAEWKEVISGVPHGSVFDPLLFNIFINSIESDLNSMVLQVADDRTD